MSCPSSHPPKVARVEKTARVTQMVIEIRYRRPDWDESVEFTFGSYLIGKNRQKSDFMCFLLSRDPEINLNTIWIGKKSDFGLWCEQQKNTVVVFLRIDPKNTCRSGYMLSEPLVQLCYQKHCSSTIMITGTKAKILQILSLSTTRHSIEFEHPIHF